VKKVIIINTINGITGINHALCIMKRSYRIKNYELKIKNEERGEIMN